MGTTSRLPGTMRLVTTLWMATASSVAGYAPGVMRAPVGSRSGAVTLLSRSEERRVD